MSERIIEISRRGMHLKIKNGMLAVSEGDTVISTVSLEDINTIILTERAISLTGAVLSECALHNIPAVVCDSAYRPSGLLQPLNNTSVHNVIYLQIEMRKSLKKQLWKEIIRYKILNQAAVLKSLRLDDRPLSSLVDKVHSGDSTNVEARAASIFWKSVPFVKKRDRTQNDINILFNYAYMVIWGAAARAVCATGLNPCLGISHHGKYNPFSLASDIMEPYRFLAETAVSDVVDLFEGFPSAVIKKKILDYIYNTSFFIKNRKVKLTEGLETSAASLKKSLFSGKPCMLLPKMQEVN